MVRTPSPVFLDENHMLGLDLPSDTVARPRTRSKVIPFGWYGGKFNHLDWLLPLLPDAHHYCEPFGGSGAVLLNRPPSPVETYNDLDGEVVNFFRVLREQKDDLVAQIALTPFSREEYFLAVSDFQLDIPPLRRALHFTIRARQSRSGLAQTASLGRWANCKNTSRAGMSGVVSRWLGSVEGLPDIAMRLLRVQIENRPATDVIALYDDEGTVFYCDPPYPHDSRGDTKSYSYEMADADHVELSRVLHRIKGKAAISGYQCGLLDDLYSDWTLHLAPPKQSHAIKQIRQEALWTNF